MIRRAEPSAWEAYRAIRLPSVCGAGQHCARDLQIADVAGRRQDKRLVLEVNESTCALVVATAPMDLSGRVVGAPWIASGHRRDRTRISAEALRPRPISRRARGAVSNRRSSVTALMVSVCPQPR
jgi:hypothetical protein